jgi:quinol monooxygenase YgiN
MFAVVVVTTYRARAGEEDAVVALHEDWQLRRRAQAAGYLSGELLADLRDARTFIDVARYESAAAAQRHAADPEQQAWYRRLISLVETEPVVACYQCAWAAP